MRANAPIRRRYYRASDFFSSSSSGYARVYPFRILKTMVEENSPPGPFITPALRRERPPRCSSLAAFRCAEKRIPTGCEFTRTFPPSRSARALFFPRSGKILTINFGHLPPTVDIYALQCRAVSSWFACETRHSSSGSKILHVAPRDFYSLSRLCFWSASRVRVTDYRPFDEIRHSRDSYEKSLFSSVEIHAIFGMLMTPRVLTQVSTCVHKCSIRKLSSCFRI